jgi:hypothetical protein
MLPLPRDLSPISSAPRAEQLRAMADIVTEERSAIMWYRQEAGTARGQLPTPRASRREVEVADVVTIASEDSFPASDAPAWGSARGDVRIIRRFAVATEGV